MTSNQPRPCHRPPTSTEGRRLGTDYSGAALLTVEQLAALLQVTKNWVYDSVASRRLPYLKVGRFLRFRTCEIEQWLQDNAHPANPTASARRTVRGPARRRQARRRR